MKIVSAPLTCGAYSKRQYNTEGFVFHTHAVEINAAGLPVRVLCKRAKLENVLPDRSLYDKVPVSCPACQVKMR